MWTREYGRFHVEQRQSGHRAGEYSRPGNVGQSGHDPQVDGVTFKGPAEAGDPASNPADEVQATVLAPIRCATSAASDSSPSTGTVPM